MNKTAKITLTVPMDKVPREVGRLLDDLTVELEELLTLTKQCVANENHIYVAETIDSIRKRMNLIDLSYEDCYTILLGYVKHKTGEAIKNTKQNTQTETSTNGDNANE